MFQVPGKRTTGTKAQKYAITGPGWSGTLPDGVTEYKSPTNMVWIIGRIYCTGTPADYKAVHALQDKLGLVPLSAYGKPYTPPPGTVDPNIDMKTPVRDQVNALDAGAYFKLLASLMKDNPPTPEDAPMVAQMAKIGLVPGQGFDLSKLDPAVAKALADVPKAGQQEIAGYLTKAGAVENGWVIFGKTGIYGTDYLNRATITWLRPGRESSTGCHLSHLAVECRRQAVRRRQQICNSLRQRRAASARQRFLVADDVQRSVFLRSESSEPLHLEPAQQAQAQPRRIFRSLHTERVSGCCQGIELAAGTFGPIRSDAPAVLAQGDAPVDHRRHLETSSSRNGSLRSDAGLPKAAGANSRRREGAES